MFSHLKYAAISDVGRRRANNEDAYGAFPAAGLFCVADGMGGGDDGEVASSATVQALSRLADRIMAGPGRSYPAAVVAESIAQSVDAASRWIFDRARKRKLNGCGSTLVGVCFDSVTPDVALAFHAGDSRLYRFSEGALKQVTRDHSAAELIGAPDEAINPMFRGMIMRAVGVQSRVEIEVTPFPVRQGDRILICSDGLTRMVADSEIGRLLADVSGTEDAVRALIDAANSAGGVDNITAMLVDVGELPPPGKPASSAIPVEDMTDRESSDAGSTDCQSGTLTDDGGEDLPCFAESADGVEEDAPSETVDKGGMLRRMIGGMFSRRKNG